MKVEKLVKAEIELSEEIIKEAALDLPILGVWRLYLAIAQHILDQMENKSFRGHAQIIYVNDLGVLDYKTLSPFETYEGTCWGG